MDRPPLHFLLKPKNGRPRRALQVSAEGRIAAHTAARLTQVLLATALDCTPAMDVRRIPATGYLTEQARLHLTAYTPAATPSLASVCDQTTPHRTDRFSTEDARRVPARAASGHAAAPPSSVMNSRRFTRLPPRRARATCPARRARALWQS